MMHLRKSTSSVFLVAVAVYLILMFPSFGKSIFTYDSFYNLWRAKKLIHDPLSMFEPSFAGRFSPFSYLCLSFIQQFVGFNAFIYGLINGALHILNSFLLFCFIRRLRGRSSDIPALLASIFFLFSSIQWGVLWDMDQRIRLSCSALFLSSLLFFEKFSATKKRAHYLFSLALFAVSFGFCEDAASLPLVLLAIMGIVLSARIPFRKGLVLASPFFLPSLAQIFLSFHVKAFQGWGIGMGPHLFLNFLILIREYIQSLFIPRPEFIPLAGIPGVLLRLLPLVLIFSFMMILLWNRKKGLIDGFRFYLFGISWIVITSIPYALRPMEGVWQGRYLYLPGMGMAIMAGMMLYSVWNSLGAQRREAVRGIQGFLKGCFAGMVFYILVLNISTAIFMVRKARSSFNPAIGEEVPVVFSIIRGIREQYGSPQVIPPDMILVVEGVPFSVSRLKELLLTYYTSLPERVVEAKEGRPLSALPRQKNARILYMKWRDHSLSLHPIQTLPQNGSLDVEN